MSTTSVSFQPWARKQADDGRLQNILARVSGERGHFRDITEAALQEEIAADGALDLSASESGADDADDDGEGEAVHHITHGKPTSREELFKAKYEMLANIRAAEQEILMSVDFVSLLQSKDAPRQAQNTVSSFLRGAVPLGSLGADTWKRMPIDKEREAQEQLLATNVRMRALQQSADGLLAAATRLQDNVRKETQYWDQVLSISQAGWNICRIPNQPHRLGVSFGVGESAPDFSRRSLAALNPNADGSINVERAIGSRPKALRATLRKGAQVLGRSRTFKILDANETTLEARMRYARDSLFDEELYHEMMREGRILASLGAGMSGDAVEIVVGNAAQKPTHLLFDLVSLDEDREPDKEASNEQDAFAQAIVLAARLLLTQAHQEKLKRRSRVPPPMSEKSKDERPTMSILRPLLAVVLHSASLNEANACITDIGEVLNAAKITTIPALAIFKLPELPRPANAESLIRTLMQPCVSEARLAITHAAATEMVFAFRLETTLTGGFGTKFLLQVPWRDDAYRLDSLDELAGATDIKLAAGLVRMLVQTIDGKWRCNDNEASLIKEGIGPEKAQTFRITVDSRKKTLSLNCLARSTTWQAGGERSETSFWDAASDMF